MADTIGYIKTSVRPAVESMDRGFCGALLLVDRDTGRSISETQRPQNRPLTVPLATAWCAHGDVQFAVLVAPDDGRVFQVHQVVVLQFDQFGPDAVSPVLVRMADDDQVAHRATPSADRCPRQRRRAGRGAHPLTG